MKTLSLFNNATDFVTVGEGETIFEQGHITDLMYVLIEGQVSITRNGKELATINPGGIFGEMALLENRPHFASAIARTPSKLVPINRKRFQFLVEQTPNFALDILEIMADRLHQMNIKATN